jgi:regulatory protein
VGSGTTPADEPDGRGRGSAGRAAADQGRGAEPPAPRSSDPTGHRLSMEDLAPAVRAEVEVVSFDETPDTPDAPGGGAVADFEELSAPAPPLPAESSDVRGARDRRSARAPSRGEIERAEKLRAAIDDVTRSILEVQRTAPPPAPRTARAPRDRGREDEGPAEPPEVVLVDLDALGETPDRQPPAELGGLPEPAPESPQLTMDDLRFGGRSRRPDDAPALDTESAAWEAGEFTAIGSDPEREPRRQRGRGRARARRGRPQEPVEDTRSPEEQEAAAKELCLRLLTDRARSKHELGAKLKQKGVADEIAERVLDRFDEVGLIDDEAFAGAWVRSRHRHRGLGRRAIAQELRRKGIDKDLADEALTEVDDEAEAQRARELVDRKLRTVTVSGPEDRRKVGQRLIGMLARKGYPSSIAYGVVRTALAEHGAEEDELGPADDL